MIAVRVADAGEKAAILASNSRTFFTEDHYNGYSAVLVVLNRIDLEELRGLIVDAWLARAPKRLADRYVAEHS